MYVVNYGDSFVVVVVVTVFIHFLFIICFLQLEYEGFWFLLLLAIYVVPEQTFYTFNKNLLNKNAWI